MEEGRLTEVLIIGAGQQGLALGYRLKTVGIPFLILEAGNAIGAHWRTHYDSLKLFTPRRYSALPGLPLLGNPDGVATKDEFADYLGSYAEQFNLPIVLNARVLSLTKEGNQFKAVTADGTYRALTVVVATGSEALSGELTAHGVFSLHSRAYQNPSQIPEGKVLVVGNGNSAAQIALELMSTHTVAIAMRKKPFVLPEKILGKSFYWWGEHLGTHSVPADSLLGKFVAGPKDPLIGSHLMKALRKGTIARKLGLVAVENDGAVFDDGSRERFATIIFATGYRPSYAWLKVEGVCDADGKLLHKRGVSTVSGLFFAGLRNQLSSISQNIYGAKYVSAFLMKKIVKSIRT